LRSDARSAGTGRITKAVDNVLNMKKILIIITILLLVVLFIYTVYNIATGEKMDWVEGQCQVSPNKEWAVYIQTTSTPVSEESYCKIFIFNTGKYPNLKKPGQFPTALQKNNPKASYLLPIQFYAREMKIEWASDNNYVMLKQASLIGNPPISYIIDLKTFNLYRRSQL
jgi:hypothetical protein